MMQTDEKMLEAAHMPIALRASNIPEQVKSTKEREFHYVAKIKQSAVPMREKKYGKVWICILNNCACGSLA